MRRGTRRRPPGRTRWPSACRASETRASRVRSARASPSCHPVAARQRRAAAAQGSVVGPDRGALPRARGRAAGDDNDAPTGLGRSSRRLSRARQGPMPPPHLPRHGIWRQRRAHRLRPRSADGARGGAAGALERMPTRPGSDPRHPARPRRGRQPHRRPSGTQARGGRRALLPHRPHPDHRSAHPAGRDRRLVGAVPARQPGGAASGRRLRRRRGRSAGRAGCATGDHRAASHRRARIRGRAAGLGAGNRARMRPETAPETSPETPLADAAPEDEAAADGIELADTVVPPPPDADPAPVETVAPEETAVVPPLPPLPLDSCPEPRGDRGRLCRIPHLAASAGPARPRAARLAVGPVAVSVDPAVAALDAISLPAPRSIRPRRCAACPPPPPFGARPERPQAASSRHCRGRGHARWRPRHRRPASGSGHPPPA
jgi:hypothetical protein